MASAVRTAMTAIKVSAIATAALLMAGTAQATIVDISAYDASAANGVPTPVTESFGPGTYTAQVIGKAQGGAYNAWSVATPAAGNWDDRYNISIGGTTTQVNPYNGQRFATDTAALAAFANNVYTFTLSSLTAVTFSIPDYLFYDNTGGVSVAVNPVAVPEPPMLLLFAGAVGAIALTMSRRNRRDTNIA